MPRGGGAFGDPKPLAGTGRARMTESQVLEQEAREMENRLRMLQTRMTAQAEEDAAVPRVGGSRWRGARTDKGSVTRYNQTMQERHTKRSNAQSYQEAMALSTRGGSNGVMSEAKRETRTKGHAATKIAAQPSKSDDVEAWSVQEVGAWLEELGLPQYVEVFTVNEITGAVLIDLSLDDLDYMEIKTLGHRKNLLKAVAKLQGSSGNRPASVRRPARSEVQPQRSQSLENLPVGASSSSPSSSSSSGKQKHWSQLEPIANNVVTHGGEVPVNPGDGMIDEAAEQRAFQEAVMEWRRGAAMEQARQDQGTAQDDDSLWHNPWAADAKDDDAGEPPATSKETKGERGGVASLSMGEMDEEAERRAFQAAVAEWRSSSGTQESEGAGSASGADREEMKAEGDVHGMQTETLPGDPAAPMPSSHATAQALAARLEAEHEASIKELRDRRAEMEQKLKMASMYPDMSQELEERRAKLAVANAAMNDDMDDDDDDDDDNGMPNTRVVVDSSGTTGGLPADFNENYYVVEEDSD